MLRRLSGLANNFIFISEHPNTVNAFAGLGEAGETTIEWRAITNTPLDGSIHSHNN
jgi:hypothetical protein